jgi:hypothetical protein
MRQLYKLEYVIYSVILDDQVANLAVDLLCLIINNDLGKTTNEVLSV